MNLVQNFFMQMFSVSVLPTQYRHIEHLPEEVWCQKIIIDKINY